MNNSPRGMSAPRPGWLSCDTSQTSQQLAPYQHPVWPGPFLTAVSFCPALPFRALQPSLGGPHVSHDQDPHRGCWSLLWNSPCSLKVGTFAHSVSSGLASDLSPPELLMVAWQTLSSALQTFPHGQLVRVCGGQPIGAVVTSPRVSSPTLLVSAHRLTARLPGRKR